MTRYDWPGSPRSADFPAQRAGHLRLFRPTVDPDTIADLAPLPPRSRRRPRAIAHNAPVGNQNLWFPVGPSVMTHGQATGEPNVAGRIRDLQVEPIAGGRVYAASATGGVWFSGDRGVSWRPLDEWRESPDRADVGVIANALACGSIHVEWGGAQDGSADEVWVGTGELTGDATPAPGGRVRGVGFLTTGPGAAGWSVVKGDPASADPDTLRGETIVRIVADPGNPQQLFAATSKGIYFRPPGGAWTKFAPWTAGIPVDVVLTRPAANRVRIWVAEWTRVSVAEFTGPAATPINPAGLAFTAVPLPDVYVDTRLAIAASPDGTRVYVLGRRVRVAADSGNNPPAQLWLVDATAATAAMATAATKLTGTPPHLFGATSDQSWYDMCVTVHPTVAGRVFIGGSAVDVGGQWNGAIYRCETTATAITTATMVGEGVHADVHVVRVGGPGADPTKRTVLVGCDGGMFRSESEGDPRTFTPQNDGLAVLEPGYVASHPTNAGIVAAGFQDNGTAVRTGDTVWRQTFGGDGGGIVYDPAATNRYFRQYIRGDWSDSEGAATPPVFRRGARVAAGSTMKTSETIESDASLFYAGADAVLHGGYSHLAIGSNRVWYSRDWGRSWVTLPTATDPRDGDVPNLAQDLIAPVAGGPTHFTDRVGSTECCASNYVGTAASGTGILAVKFATPADAAGVARLRILALYAGGLVWLQGARPAGETGAFTWVRVTTATPLVRQVFRNPVTPAETTSFTNGDPLQFMPVPGRVSDVAVHDPDRGALGSCYVSTTGSTTFAAGTPGARQDTLWFFDGDHTWVPTGLRTVNPRGTWPNLPAPPAGRTSRVTAPALGVVVDLDDRTRVYVATSVGVVRGILTIGVDAAGNPTYVWAWEQFMNGLPEAAVQDLSIHRSGTVRLLRAALQSRGIWETDLANVVTAPLTYLRLYPTDTRRRLPTPLSGPTVAGEPHPPRWDGSPDILLDTSGAAPLSPTEAELLRRIPRPVPHGAASASLNTRFPVVHVLVHQRWSSPAAEVDVRVALIRHELPANGVVPLGGVWPALVAAAASGNPPATLPDGWTVASASLWKNPDAPVDTRIPRVVMFDLDLTADPLWSSFVLVAVVMSASNQISPADLLVSPGTNATTVDQLVTTSPHVAARSVALVG